MKKIIFFLIKVFLWREGIPAQRRMDGKLIKIRVMNSSRQHGGSKTDEQKRSSVKKKTTIEKMFYLN